MVRGKTAKGPYEQRLELKEAKAGPENAALRLLWARQRIMNLVDFSHFDRENQEVVKEVTALGLKYSLMTPYTSFVAVDQVKRADGQVVTVKQPLPLPEGVSDLAIGESRSKAMMPSMMPRGRHPGCWPRMRVWDLWAEAGSLKPVPMAAGRSRRSLWCLRCRSRSRTSRSKGI